jgi:hypothetical protein
VIKSSFTELIFADIRIFSFEQIIKFIINKINEKRVEESLLLAYQVYEA